jgi:ADP-heptose:LPS heptosyltransferase
VGFKASVVPLMQRMDGIIGPILCFLATGLRRLAPERSSQALPRSILFIKLSEQGATVLAAAALREAVRRVGRDQVHFVTFTGNREILDLMEIIPPENVIELDNHSLRSFFRGLVQLGLRFRHLRPDAAIDLDFFTRASALLTWATGAPRRVGLHAYFGEGPYRGDLMTHRCRYNPHWHTARFFLALVQALDQEPSHFPTWPTVIEDESALRPPQPILPETAKQSAASLIRRCFKIESVPLLVLLNANCSDLMPLRKWMPERYVELARQLLERHPNLHVLFTGGPSEAAETEALAALVTSVRCASIAGRTTLTELLAIYDLAAVLVTNDSGPVHFASLTQIKTVALFGPETPALFGPLGNGAVALTASLACSPCVSAQNSRQSRCQDNLCLRAISVATVYDAVSRSLSLPATAPAPP